MKYAISMATIVIIAMSLMALNACSVSLKQNVTLSLQTSEAALEGAQTIERTLCFNAPATESGPVCTNQLGIAAGLNKMVQNPNAAQQMITTHQLIAFYFDQAFGYVKLAAIALPAWKAGDPAPTSVVQYQADALAVLAEAQKLFQSVPSVTSFVAKAKEAVNAGAVIATAVGVK